MPGSQTAAWRIGPLDHPQEQDSKMATTYYVDSATGSDSNAGTSASAPLQSMAAVEALQLQPGDTVLFARGTSYDAGLDVKWSGSPTNPITFGAYGTGEPPVIGDTTTGIYGSKTQNIVVEDLAISHVSGNAIFALGASSWTVQNVHVTDSGSPATSGAIAFENSANVTIRDSTISGVTGDGIFVDGGKNIVIQNNQVGTVQGPLADNVQVTNATNVSILGNHLDMTGPTDSTKGNLVVNVSDGVIVENNVMTGGSYGASVNSDNVTIAYNEVYGQSGYKWSFGIGIGETWDVRDYRIYDNYVHDVAYGVAITGRESHPAVRTNIDVHDNTFDNIGGAAVKVDQPATGEFVDNSIGSNSTPAYVSDAVVAAGTFTFGTNPTFASTGPEAVSDSVVVGQHAYVIAGNLLANDVGSGLSVAAFAGEAVGSHLEVATKYGTVYINQDGTFEYVVDQNASKDILHVTPLVFDYLVTDGVQQSISQLTLTLKSHVEVAPVAVNDTVSVASDGTVAGNLLTNDYDYNGDALYLRSIAGQKVGQANLDIAGKYGTLTISADGQFSYAVDPSKVGDGQSVLHESFLYKISDTAMQDTGSLGIYIDPHSLAVHTTDIVL
jgi:polysaccharidase protein